LRARGFGAGFAEAEDVDELDLGELDPVVDSSGVSPSLFVRLGLRGLAGGSILIVPPVPQNIPLIVRYRESLSSSDGE
jgi:hypothetical protein